MNMRHTNHIDTCILWLKMPITKHHKIYLENFASQLDPRSYILTNPPALTSVNNHLHASTQLVTNYSPTYLTCIQRLSFMKQVTKAKPNINSVRFHPELNLKGLPMDGAPVACWFTPAILDNLQSGSYL
jgi:hypothetical protein